ncbi:hypothetical protein P8452_55462 [Trifolium repens]|nr:hypothetical protein P8452_55462 [Trifolium repens]
MQEEHRRPHNLGSQQVAHGTEEHHDDHEKKSVLKKVKAKAKKIKDTITKHGHHDDNEHGHGHGHDQYHYENQHIPDDHDLDEEDDEDVHDPEIHGAPIYDSAKIRNVTPTGKVKNSGQGVNFGSTTIMGEEHHHHEPRVVVVKPSTENINQSKFNEPPRTFVREERTMVQPKVNLEEDPHAPGSRFQAYAPANYQTKVTDPTGIGGAEIDITPIQKSIDRMTVSNEPIPNYQQPKTLSTISETQHHSPSLGTHHQFSPEISAPTKTPYPSSTITHNQNLPQQSPEIKTQYPKSHEQFTPVFSTSTQTQHPITHDQNLPHFSSGTRTQYPSSATSHDHVTPNAATKTTSMLLPTEPKLHQSSATSHDTYLPLSSGGIMEPQHTSATSHGTFLPGATESRYPFNGSHDQFKTDPLPTEAKPQHSFATIHDQYVAPYSSATEPKLQHQSVTSLLQHSSAMKTQYPSAGSHEQFRSELLPTEHHSATRHGQHMPQPLSGMKTQYPSAGSHDQFTPGFSTNNRNMTVEEQPQLHHESMENSSNQSNNSYTDKIYSATSAIADKAADAKNAVASKLGYGEQGETRTGETPSNQSSYTDKIYSAASAVTGTAAVAKNAVASKLGYGEKGETTTTTDEAPSDQSSYTDKIYSATSAVTDKAASAKNAVVSKLGYGETPSNQSSHSSATSAVAPANQTSYTEKISSATSAIADKAASAKNTVASKLGFGEKNETETETDSKVRTFEENNNNSSSSAVSPAEYGNKIAVSLTEKLAPVYGKATGVGTERGSGGIEQDKGVSMKDYIAEKLRPGEDDRALSEAISESLYKKSVDESVEDVYHNNEGRDVRKVVSDAVHKRGDDDEGREVQRPRGKVTESEEVKRRLGGWDEEIKEGDFGKGMVDMVKDVVGSWFEKPGENESTQGTGDLSKNIGGEVGQVHQTVGERRLHESTN